MSDKRDRLRRAGLLRKDDSELTDAGYGAVIDGLDKQDVDVLIRVQKELEGVATAAGEDPDHYFDYVRF